MWAHSTPSPGNPPPPNLHPNPSSLPSPSIQGADLEGQKGGTRHQKLHVSCLILYMVDFLKEVTSPRSAPAPTHSHLHPFVHNGNCFQPTLPILSEWGMISTGKRKLLMRKNLYLVIEICHDDIKTVCINYSSKSFPADTLCFVKKKYNST